MTEIRSNGRLASSHRTRRLIACGVAWALMLTIAPAVTEGVAAAGLDAAGSTSSGIVTEAGFGPMSVAPHADDTSATVAAMSDPPSRKKLSTAMWNFATCIFGVGVPMGIAISLVLYAWPAVVRWMSKPSAVPPGLYSSYTKRYAKAIYRSCRWAITGR